MRKKVLKVGSECYIPVFGTRIDGVVSAIEGNIVKVITGDGEMAVDLTKQNVFNKKE